MRIFAVGDIQGCYDELCQLEERVGFDPDKDQLWCVGDLVNRGPSSLAVLRHIRELGDAVVTVCGNHDLHLIALALAEDVPAKAKGLHEVFAAPDCAELVEWLRNRPLAHYSPELNTLMVHAGVAREWSAEQTVALAAEVESALRGSEAGDFLAAMYGDQPSRWSRDLAGMDRLRFITNCLTRIRFCRSDGSLELKQKGSPGTQPEGLLPWFDLPDRRTRDTRIVFGHWSMLGLLQRDRLLSIDTGCVWGGTLTAVRIDTDARPIQVESTVNRLKG